MRAPSGRTDGPGARDEGGAWSPPPLRVVRTSVGELALGVRGPIDFVDASLPPSAARLRVRLGHHDFDPGLVARATVVRAEDGAGLAPLRTFSGRLNHENGLVPSRKSRRLLGYQGETQENMIVKAQTMHGVVAVGSESVRIEYVDGGVAETYTSDIELVGTGRRSALLELKRDEDDLADPDYCRKLAIVAEICRCCAIPFDVLFSRDVFLSRTHRRQAWEFASRAFVPFDGGHRAALRRHAEETGGRSAFGAVRDALCATSRLQGVALLQAMTVARLIEIDLVRAIRDETPVLVHAEAERP